LNEVNVWIKFIIIIFLKPDLEVEQVKDLNYRSKGSIKVNQIKKKKSKQPSFDKKIQKIKINKFFTRGYLGSSGSKDIRCY
jgi:hypothetical protein